MRIKAFQALRPCEDKAALVASVPYDVVDTEEARILAGSNPCSFLRVSRPEIEFPAGTDAYSDQVYERGAANLGKLQAEGILVRENKPYLYVYRQIMGSHAQRGIVACCHVEDYEHNVIRKHEKTRKDKEDDRTRHVKTLRAHTGPVFLTYKEVAAIDRLVAAVEEAGKPMLDITAPDGIRHTVWRIPEAEEMAMAFKSVDLSYIADGHHRAAASARTAAECRSANPGHTGTEEYNWFMAVLFPANQLRILPYNRCVVDLNGLTEDKFISSLQGKFRISVNSQPSPAAPRHASMYISGKWYGLEWDEVRSHDPVAVLDVSYLQDSLLSPLLGIKDPRTDTRIEFIGGIRGTGELEKRVGSGRAAVAFSMYPVSVGQMMAIADADRLMPPKSTWFEPKLRSGLLVHTF